MVIHITDDIKITQKTLDKITTDPQATAKAIKLVYVRDSDAGFTRVRNGKNFRYLYKNKAHIFK